MKVRVRCFCGKLYVVDVNSNDGVITFECPYCQRSFHVLEDELTNVKELFLVDCDGHAVLRLLK